jgi:hypothetical protein
MSDRPLLRVVTSQPARNVAEDLWLVLELEHFLMQHPQLPMQDAAVAFGRHVQEQGDGRFFAFCAAATIGFIARKALRARTSRGVLRIAFDAIRDVRLPR